MDKSEADDIGTVRWFGATWWADVCDPRAHVPTPAGLPCDHAWREMCSGVIEPDAQGIQLPAVILGVNGPETLEHPIVFHLDCWLRSMGINPATGLWSPCCEEHTPGPAT